MYVFDKEDSLRRIPFPSDYSHFNCKKVESEHYSPLTANSLRRKADEIHQLNTYLKLSYRLELCFKLYEAEMTWFQNVLLSLRKNTNYWFVFTKYSIVQCAELRTLIIFMEALLYAPSTYFDTIRKLLLLRGLIVLFLVPLFVNFDKLCIKEQQNIKVLFNIQRYKYSSR